MSEQKERAAEIIRTALGSWWGKHACTYTEEYVALRNAIAAELPPKPGNHEAKK